MAGLAPLLTRPGEPRSSDPQRGDRGAPPSINGGLTPGLLPSLPWESGRGKPSVGPGTPAGALPAPTSRLPRTGGPAPCDLLPEGRGFESTPSPGEVTGDRSAPPQACAGHALSAHPRGLPRDAPPARARGWPPAPQESPPLRLHVSSWHCPPRPDPGRGTRCTAPSHLDELEPGPGGELGATRPPPRPGEGQRLRGHGAAVCARRGAAEGGTKEGDLLGPPPRPVAR